MRTTNVSERFVVNFVVSGPDRKPRRTNMVNLARGNEVGGRIPSSRDYVPQKDEGVRGNILPPTIDDSDEE